MVLPASRITDLHAHPVFKGVVPHIGAQILSPGVATVLIGRLPTAHATHQGIRVDLPDVIVRGSVPMLTDKVPAVRICGVTTHGGTIVAGLPTALISG